MYICHFRFNFTPTEEEKRQILAKFENNLIVPLNFEQTQPGHSNITTGQADLEVTKLNPQTKQFCQKLEVDDPIELLLKHKLNALNMDESVDVNTTQSFINDSDLLDDAYDSPLENTSTSKPFKLNLPEPKNIEGSDLGDTNGNVSQPIIQCDSNKATESIAKHEYNATPIKKFKRRNADVYANAE